MWFCFHWSPKLLFRIFSIKLVIFQFRINFCTHVSLHILPLSTLSLLAPIFYLLFSKQITLILIKICEHCFCWFFCVIFIFPHIIGSIRKHILPRTRGKGSWGSIIVFTAPAANEKLEKYYQKVGVAGPPHKVSVCWLWECVPVRIPRLLSAAWIYKNIFRQSCHSLRSPIIKVTSLLRVDLVKWEQLI